MHNLRYQKFSTNNKATPSQENKMEEEHEAAALHSRRKKSSISISCCFNSHRRGNSFDISSSSSSAPLPSPGRSPSAWIRSKTPDLPEIKGKYKNFMSRMGRHRRHSSADFSYDPLSYSLNFQDQYEEPHESDDPFRSFTSRLPLSPPRRPAIAPVSSWRKVSEAGVPLPREEAAAEVRESLEDMLSKVEVGSGLEGLTLTPVKKAAGSVEQRRSVERANTPRAAAVAEVRRSLEDVTPSVVARRPSRQVLVELC